MQFYILRTLFFMLAFSFSCSFAAEKRQLKESDIHPVMQQILSQHVSEKSMSKEMLKRSLQGFLYNFDGSRIYLLQEEVDPYLNISDRALEEVFAKYQNNDFSFYREMETLFQKAIQRSKQWRQKLLTVDSAALEKALEKKQRHGDLSLEERNLPFAKTLKMLQNRIEGLELEFLQRCLAKKATKDYGQLLSLYEKHIESYEREYLYQDAQGNPLGKEESENRFALHVLKALAASLDAHTAYFDPSETYDMRVRLEKGFHGVGLVLEESDKGIQVAKVMEGSPAAKNGQIEVGDRLVQVDKTAVAGLDFSAVMDLIRGEAGSSVFFKIEKKGGEAIQVTLKRELIAIKEDRVDIGSEAFQGGIIGKITLHSFYEGENGISSESDIKEAIKSLQEKGPLKGLVLDLRDNLGGFLLQAVKVTGLFISNGVVVVSKYANGEEHVFRDLDGRIYYEGPFVVLTSRVSASAAEIVAQALQDYGLAIIVGDEHTYGKGSIQHQTVTDAESLSSFKVTVGRYYTVSGKSTQMRGVQADVVVPSVLCYEKIGEAYLDYALAADHIQDSYADTLADVDESLKNWYEKYYMPSLQPRLTKWRRLIPELKKRSEGRMGQNQDYQALLKSLQDKALWTKKLSEEKEEEHLAEEKKEEPSPLVVEAAPPEVEQETAMEDRASLRASLNQAAPGSGGRDLQMEEAVNIVKDIILLSEKGS
ncbi:MAG: tsp1 [Chlamydiales bacterium]|jgi:carboxyl-terminal processing protease|nr:tsp1 [Chlamydiales bacterium]